MRFPWSRSDEEQARADRAEQAVAEARSHLRVLVLELAKITQRVDEKVRRAG